ncbi:Zinc finger protein [Cocos nucifera]|uniref:Zinc finger protein n=1 Tax=Cocos nucifera TaxID=13894 RepID=A0A8K0IQY0_COCNU|nr:Zinc finger protein [Cocos nucifera]
MAVSPLSFLLLRRSSSSPILPLIKISPFLYSTSLRPFSTSPLPLPDSSPDYPHPADPKPSLSARLSFVFDQIDALDRDRAVKDEALQRIRAWRLARPSDPSPAPDSSPGVDAGGAAVAAPDERKEEGMRNILRKEVEMVHPWPEWIELMERLARQNYFDLRRTDEARVAENVNIDLSGIKDEVGFDFSRDWITVRNACMNFGRDRFDLLSLRNSCSRGYILTRKEDEARTLDVMRILLAFGFDHINGSVENKALMKMKSVKTAVRKLLHEVLKLSAVPIDPNLPPPVIKKPPPKVKQPPPPPKKRVGRDDVEMKKGDWLCSKCDFMNFAKNIVCLQCDAKRPKRQLLPGEWECPQCNFLNYRRNMACFRCEHKRPADEYMENQMRAKQSGPRTRLDRAARMPDIPNAWNFDFDDNESDGADVAAFEFADSRRMGEDSSLGSLPQGRIAGGFEDEANDTSKIRRTQQRGKYFSEPDERKPSLHSPRMGFDDFDDEEDDNLDSYELDVSRDGQASDVSRKNFSELEKTSDSEDFDELDHYTNTKRGANNYLCGSEDDAIVRHPYWKSSHAADSRQKAGGRGSHRQLRGMSFGLNDAKELSLDSDDDVDEGFKSKQRNSHRGKQGRMGSRLGRISDSDDGFVLGSESDDDNNRRYSGNKTRGNKHGFGGPYRKLRSDDRKSNRRNPFASDDDGEMLQNDLAIGSKEEVINLMIDLEVHAGMKEAQMAIALEVGEEMMDFGAMMGLLIGKNLIIAAGGTNHCTEQFSCHDDGYDLAAVTVLKTYFD